MNEEENREIKYDLTDEEFDEYMIEKEGEDGEEGLDSPENISEQMSSGLSDEEIIEERDYMSPEEGRGHYSKKEEEDLHDRGFPNYDGQGNVITGGEDDSDLQDRGFRDNEQRTSDDYDDDEWGCRLGINENEMKMKNKIQNIIILIIVVVLLVLYFSVSY